MRTIYLWASAALFLPVFMGTAAHADNSATTPSFPIAGTEHGLFDGNAAERVNSQVVRARTAIAACDSETFNSAIQAIYSEKSSSEVKARDQDPIAGQLIDALFESQDEKDADALGFLTSDLYREWRAACDKPEQSDAAIFGAGASFFAGILNLPHQAFLGFENAVTLAQTIGVAVGEEEARTTGASLDGSVFFPGHGIFGSQGFWTAFGYLRTTANASGTAQTIDPAGDGLLIPGPLGGASGFALVSAGGLNVVQNATYEVDAEWDSFYAKGGLPFDCGEVKVTPFVGVAYSEQESMSRFTGSIPGFGRNFAYNTAVYVDTLSGFIGVDLEKDLGRVSVHGGGLVSIDSNDGKGTDRLSFTGVADSQASLSNDETTYGGRAWAGFTFGNDKSPFKLSIDATYIYQENLPVVERDGTNASRLTFDDGDAVVGSIRASFRF
ncbi:MAG: hypothetical protein P1U69_09050 [Parvibaculaceae bacterium]|nr:hypothetical protein [Parvibaculaceae bacterium]HBM89862.1 hypothetical protein [Rhodobiaceae bacterium]